jgi:hypothetical protein
MNSAVEALRAFALQYPEAQEGIACEGTPIEKRTIMARNKAFLFLGVSDAMLKLRDSVPAATALASDQTGRVKVGAHGWITVKLDDGGTPPLELLEAWIDESYRTIATKQLLAKLPERGPKAR